MNNKLHCLIVEDHQQARLWLMQAVAEAFPDSDIQTADSVAQAQLYLVNQVPDIALVDLGLPDGNGITIIDALNTTRNATGSKTLIVVSSVMNDDASIFNALRAGADGYLLKEEPREELISMLKGIYSGRPPLSASIARRLLGHFRPDSNSEARLGPRETQVLQLLAKGFTVKRVAEMLDITANTASGYVKDIYRKLNVNSRAEATIEASKRGLV